MKKGWEQHCGVVVYEELWYLRHTFAFAAAAGTRGFSSYLRDFFSCTCHIQTHSFNKESLDG